MYLREYVLAFITSLGLAALLTPLAGWIGRRLGLVDAPGGRRGHIRPTPRLGGLALFLAFLAAVGVGQALAIPTADPKESVRLWGLLAGSALIFIVGLMDDRWELGPLPQFAAQVVAAGVAIATLIIIERVHNPLTNQQVVFPAALYIPFTLFWIVGMINTVNWLDGLDGLAAGVAAILCIVLAVHMHRVNQPSVVLLPLALLGATLGFLPYNFHPARVFLGSAGALFLGYTLGCLGIIAGARMATVLLVMGLPIVDLAWQIFDRLRRGRSPARPDRGHLHFRLLDLGLSQRTIVLVYWGLCGLFGLLALTIASRLYKLVALVMLGMGVAVMLAWLTRDRVKV